MVRRLLVRASLALVCALTGRDALADGGRFPASNEIIFSPSDPNLIVARATYGILMSRDHGTTWQYLCLDAVGLSPVAFVDPQLGLTATNALVAGTSSPYRGGSMLNGLNQSTDLGCSWNCMGGTLADQPVVDLVVRTDAPDAVLALTSIYQPSDTGGALSQVFESTDDGVQWKALGAPFDPEVYVQTIGVAPTDPARLYVSGTRGAGAQKSAALFVSTDEGAHWSERPLTQFDPSIEETVWVAAVDPTDADRVYVRSSASVYSAGKSRLFLTTDAGQTFRTVLEFQVPAQQRYEGGPGELLGFALSPDGSKIYAGSKRDGLFMAAKQSDLAFERVNPSIAVQCLAARGNELWACSNAISGFIVGVSTDDGAHFCPKMTEITNLSGSIECGSAKAASLACGATINGSGCQASFDQFCWSYPSPCQAEAGPGCDTGADAASGNGARSRPGGCGCSMAGARGASGFLALSGLAIAWRKRWRRRPSRR